MVKTVVRTCRNIVVTQLNRTKTQSFILELALKVQPFQADILNSRFELARNIYNACVRELEHRYALAKQSKKYQKIMSRIKETYRQEEKQKHLNHKNGTKRKVSLNENRKLLYKELNQVYDDFGLNEYSLHAFAAPMHGHFSCHIDAFTGQKIASQAWKSMKAVLFNKGKKLHYKKFGQMNSVEGKSNKAGIRYSDKLLYWRGLVIPVRTRKSDNYVHETLSLNRVKYCRIIRRFMRGQNRFFLQLILEGIPLKKVNGRKTKDASVGLDIGPQTIGISSNESVKLLELAPSVQKQEHEIRRLMRKLDRQRRANNPDKYNVDGTCKKENGDTWVRSKNYLKTLSRLKDLKRKQAAIRKQDHEILANQIIALGNCVKTETMRFDALAKRVKEVRSNGNTGRPQQKARFGKSIVNKAPSMLLSILNRKLGYFGKSLLKVNTQKVRASQYNHLERLYTKKSLDERWNVIQYNETEIKIQRDLYSAFLIQHVNPFTLDEIDNQECDLHFENFLTLHDREIRRLVQGGGKLVKSMGI